MTTHARHRSRDKISNGHMVPSGIDGRSATARRFRHLAASYARDLGSDLTEQQRDLVRQAAALQVGIEQMQAKLVRGEIVNASEITQLSGEHRQVLASLRGGAR